MSKIFKSGPDMADLFMRKRGSNEDAASRRRQCGISAVGTGVLVTSELLGLAPA